MKKEGSDNPIWPIGSVCILEDFIEDLEPYMWNSNISYISEKTVMLFQKKCSKLGDIYGLREIWQKRNKVP